MEPTLSNNTTTEEKETTSSEKIAVSASQQPESVIVHHEAHHHTQNLYPRARHIILVSLVLFSIALIIFLMHQNGKSIYDNGL